MGKGLRTIKRFSGHRTIIPVRRRPLRDRPPHGHAPGRQAQARPGPRPTPVSGLRLRAPVTRRESCHDRPDPHSVSCHISATKNHPVPHAVQLSPLTVSQPAGRPQRVQSEPTGPHTQTRDRHTSDERSSTPRGTHAVRPSGQVSCSPPGPCTPQVAPATHLSCSLVPSSDSGKKPIYNCPSPQVSRH